MKTLLRHWPILVLALWFGGMTVLLDHAFRLFEQRTTPNPDDISAPAPWRGSRLFVDPDSCAWLSYARDLRESPHFRVRSTHMDNAPHGRPVHWSQLPIWLLCGIAAALEAAGIPSPASLELAGRILLPLLGFLSFSALWLFLRRRAPPLFAALATFSAAAMLFWDFHPFRPDHHGFHLAAASAFTLPLLFSSFGFAPPSRRNDIPFIVSGIFGGIALWLGATVFFFTLAAAALAAAFAVFPKKHDTSSLVTCRPSRVNPSVWRLWALSGAATSLFFWLLEYAPSHFSMRLEANHPLYALSFLGTGECLYLLFRFRHAPATRLSPAVLLHALLALTAAAALPALVLFGPVAWYIPRSVLMLRIHAHIDEFLPLPVFAARHGKSFLPLLLRPILPALAAVPLFCRPASRRILFALPFFVLSLTLFLWQDRWEPFAALAALWLLLAAVTTPRTAPAAVRPPALRILPGAALSLQLALCLWAHLGPLPDILRGLALPSHWFQAFQFRALAAGFPEALRAPEVERTPNAASPVLLGPAELAPFFYWYARIPSVASLYWENLPGNSAAAGAFADAAPGAPAAHAIVSDRRISHLLMTEGPHEPLFFDCLHTGVFDQSHAACSLGGLLAGSRPGAPLPSWLAVDPELNRLANPVLHSFIPPRGFFAPARHPVRIYSLMTPPP